MNVTRRRNEGEDENEEILLGIILSNTRLTDRLKILNLSGREREDCNDEEEKSH